MKNRDAGVLENTGGETIDRRQLLLKAAAVVGGAVAAAALPTQAMATNGDAVLVGQIAAGSTTLPALWGSNVAGGNGVYGYASSHDGVVGVSAAAGRSGVYGQFNTAGGWGVFGRGNNAASRGVQGESTAGVGTFGRTDTGTGVWAECTSTGKALYVNGKAGYRRSGVFTIHSGSQKPKVTVPFGVTSSSKFLVTLQGSPGSGVYFKYAKYYDPTRFRIVLNKKATKACKAAWMVLD
jgi:hypothetical protein